MKADRELKAVIRRGLAKLSKDAQDILLEEFCLWGDRAQLDNVPTDKLPELKSRIEFILYPDRSWF